MVPDRAEVLGPEVAVEQLDDGYPATLHVVGDLTELCMDVGRLEPRPSVKSRL